MRLVILLSLIPVLAQAQVNPIPFPNGRAGMSTRTASAAPAAVRRQIESDSFRVVLSHAGRLRWPSEQQAEINCYPGKAFVPAVGDSVVFRFTPIDLDAWQDDRTVTEVGELFAKSGQRVGSYLRTWYPSKGAWKVLTACASFDSRP
jgi:hypothetical protein